MLSLIMSGVLFASFVSYFEKYSEKKNRFCNPRGYHWKYIHYLSRGGASHLPTAAHVVPVKPFEQMHLKLGTPGIQNPEFWHGLGRHGFSVFPLTKKNLFQSIPCRKCSVTLELGMERGACWSSYQSSLIASQTSMHLIIKLALAQWIFAKRSRSNVCPFTTELFSCYVYLVKTLHYKPRLLWRCLYSYSVCNFSHVFVSNSRIFIVQVFFFKKVWK